MPLLLVDLDAETRQQMREEVVRDMDDGRLYLSPRLSPVGVEQYSELLLAAVDRGDDTDLGRALAVPGLLLSRETYTRRGRAYSKAVPRDAAESLAEGEFNRFYVRGLCLVAMALGAPEVEVYRARASRQPRAASVALEGQRLAPEQLLADLRASIGLEPALGLGFPRSGLSVRHPRT